MKIHEFQAKKLFRDYGVAVPDGEVADTPAAAEEIARRLGGPVVIKAQVHAGGRGKAGGIKTAATAEEARQKAEQILGLTLVTKQTGAQGRIVRKVLVEKASAIARELYCALAIDRENSGLVLIVSTAGGMDIEEVARTQPNKIRKIGFGWGSPLTAEQMRAAAKALELAGEQVEQAVKIITGGCRLFVEKDAALVEINPLIVTTDGRLIALDAKINFDDNALFRHPDIQDFHDPNEVDPRELEAAKFNLNYIKLDGNIGCMVNGAGLAMATMDIIKHYGGEPANFLDVGGGATSEQVAAAFKILIGDSKVRAVLVNIFGGIMKCDVIAEGLIAAMKQVDLKAPLVVRLEGTNVELGRQLLKDSQLPVIAAADMADGARKVVAAAQGAFATPVGGPVQ